MIFNTLKNKKLVILIKNEYELKIFIKERFPKFWYVIVKLLHPILIVKYRFKNPEEVFTYIYKNQVWKENESLSGSGSDIEPTKTLQEELPKLLKELKILTILDIPCGDFNWLKEVDLSFLSYTGADIVEELVNKNIEKYSSKQRKFIKLNILEDELFQTDMIFCRDLLQHFSNKHIFQAIDNIKKSKSRYLLTSSQIETKENSNIITGDFRSLNLLLPPFSFPKPLRIIGEKFTTKEDSEKSLLLWKINEI